MHRNTFITVIFLTLMAALLIGVNIGRRLNPEPESSPSPQSSPITITTSPSPATTQITFSQNYCGISFMYPSNFEVAQASDAATLTDPQGDKISLVCGVDFPKPPLLPEKIESATIAGQLATIYHDASAKDGTPLDVAVFTNPKNNLEVAFFGFGEVFNQLLKSLTLLP